MALLSLEARMTQMVTAEADKAALEMEGKAITLAPKFQSALVGRIHGYVTVDGPIIRSRLECASPYGKYIEEGTGPAAGHAKYMPPRRALILYVTRKMGVTGPASIAHAVRALQWKIYMKGTEAQPFMKPAWTAVAKTWKARVKRAAFAAIKEARRG